MAASEPRYDGHSDWYDETFRVFDEDAAVLERLVGHGEGQVCLDIACGTGRYTPTLKASGYDVIGVDISADQLRVARARTRNLLRGDASLLGLRSGSVAVAVGMYFHTDVEDFAGVVAEVTRCLEPGGRLIYVGLHPCFIGPFVNRSTEAETHALRFGAGYGVSGWNRVGSGGGVGLWSRVGGHHKTLASFLKAFLDAGLLLDSIDELQGGGLVLPRNIAVVGAKR